MVGPLTSSFISLNLKGHWLTDYSRYFVIEQIVFKTFEIFGSVLYNITHCTYTTLNIQQNAGYMI